jgi:hypothetical protein
MRIEELVRRMQTEMEVVPEPVVPPTQSTGASTSVNQEDDDEETADKQEPSILNVLNED